MPPRRGRPARQGATTPVSTANASRDVSTAGTGRLTRASSSRNLAVTPTIDSLTATDLLTNSTESAKKPRGRPPKSSLPAHASKSAPAVPTARRGRSSNVSAIGSESVSSVPTPMEISTDSDYSTPATSKVPTPVATDLPKSTSSLEVHLPGRSRIEGPDRERALRASMYAMRTTSNAKKNVILDSDDDDDEFSDPSPDAKVARRFQKEEFAKAGQYAVTAQLPNRRRSGRGLGSTAPDISPAPAKVPTKRSRASTGSGAQPPRLQKKAKVVPDSEDSDEDSEESGINMDAEIAAGAGLSLKDFAQDYRSDEDESFLSSDGVSDLDSITSEDDEPLSRRPRNPRAPTHRVPKASQPPTAAAAASQRAAWQATLEAQNTDVESQDEDDSSVALDLDEDDSDIEPATLATVINERRAFRQGRNTRRLKKERDRLELHHPEIKTMWDELEQMPILKAGKADQPRTISRQLKPFQLEGLAWMKGMETLKWKGGLLGDEMGLGKTIQAVSLIMSDYPAKQPSLVLVPPVALMQWQSEIKSYTDGTLKTFVFHGTNQKTKGITVKELKKYDVIMMSYNSLESMYRKQEKGFKRKDGIYKEKSLIHSINFHRAILDEAHSIKTRTTMTAKACFALKTEYRWCLSGTPLQNRIGEFFSLIRFLNIRPFASYLCKQCPCSTLEWSMNEDSRCSQCNHAGMQHVSVFNQELLNPIQKHGNSGLGKEAFRKLRLMTDRIMLRRLKKDHTNSMELPVKEIYVDRQFFGEEENDFANSIMTSGQRKFDTYVAQGVLLNNYANIFGLIMQMRQVADHPDLILKKNAEGGQNVLVCCICDEPAEDTVRSRCKHDFCRACVSSYVRSTDEPDCPRCHIPLSIDLEQPEIEQDEALVKKNSIINRIKMENWTSSSKIELLVHELHKLRSDNASHKSIIFSQFTTMLQLIEWRLRRAGITTVMLDGSMTPAQRQASIEHFMTNVNVECFLVSLKAGGVALNLTEASRVFIVDPWWNPAAEWQSADRCHRIGQTRPCTITRLCIEDSVESRMVLIQEKKTNMIHSTVNGDDKAMESLSPEDMQFLFRGS
ncbi:Fc.00g047700.m01.CDS01 [Cosmosporella sp. VM-42]